jgi:phage terminase large subunit-like protein
MIWMVLIESLRVTAIGVLIGVPAAIAGSRLPTDCTWIESWDITFKGGPSSDYVVGLQGARHGADVYLVDRAKGQWDFTETCRQVLALRQRYSKTGTISSRRRRMGPPSLTY